MTKHAAFEGCQFLVYLFRLTQSCLLLLVGIGCVAKLRHAFSLSLTGLIDGSLIAMEGEIVFERHGGSIVHRRCCYRLAVEEGFQIGITHPEQRTLGWHSAKLIVEHNDRTEGDDLATKLYINLIIIDTFLQIVEFDIGRRNVAIIHMQAIVFLFIIDLLVVEHGFDSHTRGVAERFLPI